MKLTEEILKKIGELKPEEVEIVEDAINRTLFEVFSMDFEKLTNAREIFLKSRLAENEPLILAIPLRSAFCEKNHLDCTIRSKLRFRIGIETLGELASLDEEEVCILPQIGSTRLKRIKEVLASYGLELGMSFSK